MIKSWLDSNQFEVNTLIIQWCKYENILSDNYDLMYLDNKIFAKILNLESLTKIWRMLTRVRSGSVMVYSFKID